MCLYLGTIISVRDSYLACQSLMSARGITTSSVVKYSELRTKFSGLTSSPWNKMSKVADLFSLNEKQDLFKTGFKIVVYVNKSVFWLHLVAFIDHYTHLYGIVRHQFSYMQLYKTQHAYNLLQNTRYFWNDCRT